MRWQPPVYKTPTLWDRIRGYRHHDCEFCILQQRTRARVNHPPDYPPPPAAPPPPKERG